MSLTTTVVSKVNMMTAQNWQQIKELFHSALERPSGERDAFLDEACRGDVSLRSEVESLIAAHEKEGSFIDAPAYEVAAPWLIEDEADLLVGQQINHYKILSRLGAGGMGEVYLAQDTKLGRKIALKLLPASFTNDADRLHRFQQEARTASGLNHPNILTIHEIGEEQGRHFIATELIEGQTLRGRLTDGPVELSDALDIIMQVASALSAAHEVGIVHRDIKPENIMLRRDGYVKVLDFGLAKLAERRQTRFEPEAVTRIRGNTSPGMVLGTVNYMSPEQSRGLEVDERTDIWSLGVVLYEMLSGRSPFEGETSAHVVVSILEREPASLVTLSEEIPAELDWIVKKALRKERDERYQTIKEMLSDLRGVRQELEFEARMQRTSTKERSVVERETSAARSQRLPATLLTDKSAVIQTNEIREAQLTKVETVGAKGKRSWNPLIVALALIVLAVAGFAFYRIFLQSKRAAPFQAGNIILLTNGGRTIHAAISPDGKYFAYILSDGGRQSLWIRQTSATNDTQIVPPAQVGYFGITFSRDGNELYYVVKSNDPGTLYRIPALGGTPVKLLEKIDSPVSFSSDGKRMAFVRGSYPNRGDSGIFIANSDGTAEQQIAARQLPELFFPIFFTGPAWSPDGELVACAVTNVKSEYRVIAVRVKDGKEEVLTPQPWAAIGQVEWLPDMSGLVMVAKDQGSTGAQIWQLSYPDGKAWKVTNDLNFYRNVSLTADASKLMTIQLSGLINMWLVTNDDAGRAVELPEKKMVQLPTGNVGYLGGDENISWTPDGRIVFVFGSGRQGNIWIMNSDGSNRKQLTFNASYNHNPVVSPDGRYIVFTSDRAGQRNVWRMNIDGTDPKQLTNSLADFTPAITPDNQWVIYTSLSNGILTLWKVPIIGGAPTEIIHRGTFNAVVSPDGKLIAYLFTEGTSLGAPPNRIAVIAFEGGDPVKIFEVPQGNAGARTILDWSRDGRSILYTVVNNNVSNIWSQPLDGGKPVQVTNFKEHLITAFGYSRDGHQLACSRGLLIRDAVLISNAGP
jgi:serine/threonine protein kinase/Tol biopolymer transport system component